MALAYTAPTWTNGSGTGISASQLQAVCNCIEGLVQGTDKAIHNISMNGTTITLTFADGTVDNISATGIKGVVSITKTSTVGLVDTYTILYTDGTTTTFTITNGVGDGMKKDGSNAASEVVFSGAFTVGNRTGTVGTNSTAEGSSNEASGEYSHAEGLNTIASGKRAHAEGHGATASSNTSHAEGYNTTASAGSAHAEGDRTTASGDSAHAEGIMTTASGWYSHSEGSTTTASGRESHSEGAASRATGRYSHAEGYGTVAAGLCSHAQGRWNVEDNNNTYAHIVGAGTNGSHRANIETLDWSGNLWVAGKASDGGGKLGNESLLTDAYNAATTYGPIGNANNYPSWCIDGNVLYKNISQCVGVQPPNVTYWEATDVASELSQLNNSLTGKTGIYRQYFSMSSSPYTLDFPTGLTLKNAIPIDVYFDLYSRYYPIRVASNDGSFKYLPSGEGSAGRVMITLTDTRFHNIPAYVVYLVTDNNFLPTETS